MSLSDQVILFQFVVMARRPAEEVPADAATPKPVGRGTISDARLRA